jgi:CRP-like cAMP-binding protein
LRVARPGDLFGELALLQASVQHATAVALEDSVALARARATFRQVLGSNPEVGARMLEQLIRRLRDAEDQIEILMVRDQHSKVVIALMKLAQQQAGSDERPNGQVVLRVSPLELSAHVGLDVDTVKRIVMQLRESGYLSIHDEKVELPDLEHLRELYSLLGVKEQLRGSDRERPRG